MNALISLIVVFGVGVGTWVVVVRNMRKMGKSAVARHLAGALLGFLAFFVAVGVMSTIDPVDRATQEVAGSSDSDAGDEVSTEPDAVTADGETAEVIAASVAEEDVSTVDVEAEAEPEIASESSGNSISDRRDEAQAASDLGIDVETFTTRFNNAMTTIDLPFRARGNVPDMESHHVQRTLNEAFNDHLALVATVKPFSNDIRDLMFIGSGDGTAESGMNVMMAAASVFSATQEALTVDNALQMVIEMSDEVENQGDEATQTLNGLEYSYTRNEMFGNVFTVGAID